MSDFCGLSVPPSTDSPLTAAAHLAGAQVRFSLGLLQAIKCMVTGVQRCYFDPYCGLVLRSITHQTFLIFEAEAVIIQTLTETSFFFENLSKPC